MRAGSTLNSARGAQFLLHWYVGLVAGFFAVLQESNQSMAIRYSPVSRNPSLRNRRDPRALHKRVHTYMYVCM